MLCKNPYIKDAVPFGCGQCMPCRINKRRQWTHRILLESMCHESSAFVTLTYNNDNLPPNGTLDPKHLQKWQKNLRYHADTPLRFFSVGEYGDKTNRPHYHAAVFGFPSCASGDTNCPCISCKTLRASWDKGFVLNGTLTKDSAQYIAGYVTKKMTNKKDPKVLDWLQGRHPEFARMSNRPGIGAPALEKIKDMLETDHGCDLLSELQDVPDLIKIGGKEMLLGGYLKNKLREMIGVTNETKEKKLQVLRQTQISDYLTYREETPWFKALSQKEFLIEKNIQKVRQIERRNSLKPNKGEL
jgi:hypothetical protein